MYIVGSIVILSILNMAYSWNMHLISQEKKKRFTIIIVINVDWRIVLGGKEKKQLKK